MGNALMGVRTHFSTGQSILSPKEVIAQAVEAGYDAVAIADVHSINALIDASKAAQEADVKVIIGATLKIVDDLGWRKAGRGEAKKAPNPFFMPSVYVRNDEGLKDLMGLLTLANDADHFYETPQLDIDELTEALKKGNLLVTTGTTHSLLAHSNALYLLRKLWLAAGKHCTYVELTPVDSAYYDRVTVLGIAVCRSQKLPCLHSRPVLYKKGEVALRNTLNSILMRGKVTDMWRNEPADSLYVMPPEEFQQEVMNCECRLKHELPLSAENNVVDYCTYEWHKLDISLPKLADDPTRELINLAKKGWDERLNQPVLGFQPDKSQLVEYRERLSYELKIIHKLGFENYFLIVRDIVHWCKREKLMTGPGRGSVGGSLLAFLLGITDVDPLRFGLFFERFLNADRLDWPDIDLDFMSSRREEVINYLVDKYGEENVACISNYGMLGASSALRQVGSAHNLFEHEIRCSKFIGDETLEEAVEALPDIKKFSEQHEEIFQQAVGLQGVFRNAGQHAAGVVVGGEPIVNRAVIEKRKQNYVTNWDKKSIESWGLIKLDILGLSTLDLLSLAKEYLRERKGITMKFTDLPLDDRATLDTFGRGETLGVFQFEGGQSRHLLKQAAAEKALTFEDITAITAINRPGPLESGITERWMKVRNGYEVEEYLVPDLEPILKETYSQIVYQEQVMQVARVLCGFTMNEADHLRKAMGKKDPEVMAKQKEHFVKGASERITMNEAEELWSDLEKFAGYGFNKSHSVEYAIVSFYSCWLKAHHPDIFYAAALTILKEEKLQAIVKEAESKGIVVVPPDINRSSARFEIGYDEEHKQTVLYCPFQAIKGMSERASGAILQAKEDIGRDFESREEFVAIVNRRLCNKRSQESLAKIGAFASLEPDGLPARHPDRIKDQKMLLPGLVSQNVKADRSLETSKETVRELVELITDYRTKAETDLGLLNCPTPKIGKHAKIMIVMDFATWGEVDAGKFGEGKGCKSVIEAMLKAELSMTECYITGLAKCQKPKEEAEIIPAINCFAEYLDKEIELLKPAVILTLGSKAARHLIPDLKGGWEEIYGTSHYIPEKDCTILVGLAPGMIYFDPDKQTLLDKVIQQAKDLL